MIERTALLATALIAAAFGWLASDAGAAKAVRAHACIRVLTILGQVQIKFEDSSGAHVVYLDERHYQTEDLPADAEILVLGADAQFECGGARLNAISGTIFTAAEAKGREYLYLKQGELSVELEDKVVVLDRERHTFTYPKSRRDVETRGFLR